jgi:hypothetical protein
MKRRHFGLLAGSSLAALKLGTLNARAQAAPDASLLTTTLTPYGAERAGNADGSIPAWTGGYQTLPAGYQPGAYVPDPFADEQPTLVIDASNMAQYADRLSDGVMVLMTKFGYSIKVYPTHRTASAPQAIYDNIAANVGRAALNPAGGRLGFTGAFGGIPFPIPSTDVPLDAGAQIMWNHNARWLGYCNDVVYHTWLSSSGVISDQGSFDVLAYYPYYKKGGSLADFDGFQFKEFVKIEGPPNQLGEQILQWQSTNPYSNAQITWELLNGQGRVRKAPEISFDTPDGFQGGVANYDENYGFNGSLEKYDWKYITKKEMYVPYNNNGVYALSASDLVLPKYLNPEHVRWELHRVWVVEATLHPGERNVLARRKFYFDEDTWIVTLYDGWDAQDEIYHIGILTNYLRPDLPGVIFGGSFCWNMQTNQFIMQDCLLNEATNPTVKFYDTLPESDFDPQTMAAAAQY